MVPAGLTNPAGATRHEGGSSVVLGWTAPPGNRGRLPVLMGTLGGFPNPPAMGSREQSSRSPDAIAAPVGAPPTGPPPGSRREPVPDLARHISLRRAKPASDQPGPHTGPFSFRPGPRRALFSFVRTLVRNGLLPSNETSDGSTVPGVSGPFLKSLLRSALGRTGRWALLLDGGRGRARGGELSGGDLGARSSPSAARMTARRGAAT